MDTYIAEHGPLNVLLLGLLLLGLVVGSSALMCERLRRRPPAPAERVELAPVLPGQRGRGVELDRI